MSPALCKGVRQLNRVATDASGDQPQEMKMKSYEITFARPITFDEAVALAGRLGFTDADAAVGDQADYPSEETWFSDAENKTALRTMCRPLPVAQIDSSFGFRR